MLWLIITSAVALGIVFVNLLLVPPFHILKIVISTASVLAGLALIGAPLKFISYYFAVPWLSSKHLAKLISKFDERTYLRVLELRSNMDQLGIWSASKMGLQIPGKLQSATGKILKQYALGRFIAALLLLMLVVGVFNRDIKYSSTELLSGELRDGFVVNTLPTKLSVRYGDRIDLYKFINAGFDPSFALDDFIVSNDTSVSWEYKGRDAGTTIIHCDSVVVISDWYAIVSPPSYTGMAPYSVEDTVRGYVGSVVEFRLSGLLVEELSFGVSRGTEVINNAITLQNAESIGMQFNSQSFKFPVALIKDGDPKISVLSNTRDSLELAFTDDFLVTQINVGGNMNLVSNSSFVVAFPWEESTVVIQAWDNRNNYTERSVNRPAVSKEVLLSESKGKISSSKISLLKDSSPDESEGDERTKGEDSKDDIRKNSPKVYEVFTEREEPKLEELERLEEKLNTLWRIEQLSILLDEVTEQKDVGLDSAINEVALELEDAASDADLQEALDAVEEIDKEGQDRLDQAKEASDKLKSLLNEDVAELLEDNVERLKRLLKSGLFLSVFQESITRGTEVRDVKKQNNLLLLQEYLRDSLDIVIVNDQKLARALGEQRELINQAIIESRSLNNYGSNNAVSGYMVTALNELDRVLYLILESEKTNASAAKKKCKKGRPGNDGKPSLGQGSKGKKGKKPQGSRPNGRKKGQKGNAQSDSNNGKGEKGSSGDSGRSISDKLKALDEAEGRGKQSGLSKESLEEIEELRRELLLKGSSSDELDDDFEKRLWETLDSIFEKEQQGESRKSEEGVDAEMKQGKEVNRKFKISNKTSLPLPILKK